MKSLLTTLGGESPQSNKSPRRKDSILNSVDSGFGTTNTLLRTCSNSKLKEPLFKEDYLAVFMSETEKELVRNNLGVVGVSEVTKMVKDLVKEDVESFITIEKVEELIGDLDFVDSKINSRVDYVIPDKLFKL